MPDLMQVDELQTFTDQMGQVTSRPKLAGVLTDWLQRVAGSLGVGFQQSKDPSGAVWKPLKRKRPKGHNQGTRPLIDTGDMQASIISTGTGHLQEVTDDSAMMGTEDRKAAFHQFGTSRIPARPFVGISDEMADLAAEMVADELVETLRGI